MNADNAAEELHGIERQECASLDDDSVRLLAELRSHGLLNDQEWDRIKEFHRDAVVWLRDEAESVVEETDEGILINADADPRGADWIRVVRANRLAGRQLPSWAALWLWWLKTDSSRTFWRGVGKVGAQLGYRRLEELG